MTKTPRRPNLKERQAHDRIRTHDLLNIKLVLHCRPSFWKIYRPTKDLKISNYRSFVSTKISETIPVSFVFEFFSSSEQNALSQRNGRVINPRNLHVCVCVRESERERERERESQAS